MKMASTALSLDLAGYGSGPVFVHSDLMRARCFVGLGTSRQAMLEKHVQTLAAFCDGRPLWVPCFNYEFCSKGKADLRQTVCQVGPLGEYMRFRDEYWRSTDPVFSFCGLGAEIDFPSEIQVDAFGPASGLAQLYERDATVMFYGASLSSATVLHYAETRSGGPVYRYDKTFVGTITDSHGKSRPVEYVYHVRPRGMSLDYDWEQIESGLVNRGLLAQQLVGGEVVLSLGSVRSIVDHWCNELHKDPLYLLDEATAEKIKTLDIAAGCRLRQTDFEPAIEA